MTKSYFKTCDYCKEKIEMSNKEGGKWLPYNLNNGPHDCRDRDREKQPETKTETKQQEFTLEAVLQKLESIGMKIDVEKLMNSK